MSALRFWGRGTVVTGGNNHKQELGQLRSRAQLFRRAALSLTLVDDISRNSLSRPAGPSNELTTVTADISSLHRYLRGTTGAPTHRARSRPERKPLNRAAASRQ